MFLPGDKVVSIKYPEIHLGEVSGVDFRWLVDRANIRVEWSDGCADLYPVEEVNRIIRKAQYVLSG